MERFIEKSTFRARKAIKVKKKLSPLPLIVFSQFAGTSLWFAGNAVIADVIAQLDLPADALTRIVTAVQLGFIIGTIVFALLTLADRFSPSKIFFLCSLLGATTNASMLVAGGMPLVMASRFTTGFFLAGIYPIGMKIASDYHKEGLGKAMGYLLGALVLGTAFPHLLHAIGARYNWHYVIVAVSCFAIVGGLLILLLVPDGPHRVRAPEPDMKLVFKLFKNSNYRAVAFGYFGHMWELYTFWALVPGILVYYSQLHPAVQFNVPLMSFCIIATGCFGCIAGGYISQQKGSAFTAFAALSVSCLCCLLAYFAFHAPVYVFISVLLVWGLSVIADSPQFSTLVAQSVSVHEKGTALLITNALGFSLTIVSIQVITRITAMLGEDGVYFVLAMGPLLGLAGMRRLIFNRR